MSPKIPRNSRPTYSKTLIEKRTNRIDELSTASAPHSAKNIENTNPKTPAKTRSGGGNTYSQSSFFICRRPDCALLGRKRTRQLKARFLPSLFSFRLINE